MPCTTGTKHKSPQQFPNEPPLGLWTVSNSVNNLDPEYTRTQISICSLKGSISPLMHLTSSAVPYVLAVKGYWCIDVPALYIYIVLSRLSCKCTCSRHNVSWKIHVTEREHYCICIAQAVAGQSHQGCEREFWQACTCIQLHRHNDLSDAVVSRDQRCKCAPCGT